jgi:hypothetical protein
VNVLAQMFGARSPPGAVLDPWDFQDPASSPPGECRVIKITDEVRAKDAAERAAREATTAPAWTIKPELSVENLRRKATQKPIAPAKPAATRARRGPRLAQVPIPVPVAPETRVDAALPRGPVTVPEATPSSAQRARVAEKRAAAAEKERKTVLLAATLEEYEADQVWAALSGEDKLALLDIAGGGVADAR